ncbi:NADPH-dependent FMN reductase [Stakelama tenebrarum]|uniref:NAD(P)H-dependent oxidoreductase n=1 Tax=Stakelama tenebrarum TaxID=2711215 RepID=A0A6G6Y2P9_9SPHN|nr:NADPH-dependent FMN reductase [Sphingosinithalassobacter tenebrarum]QIG79224.1 NAD(P)H-dependent oxidoreductase [Sphingosinithalassobacter tenebrarum]
MLNIGLIVGSTRPERFSDKAAQWVEDTAADRSDLKLTRLDLREADLPFFQEDLPPLMSGGKFEHPKAAAWEERLSAFDGFIATVAEYNYGPAGVMKNAFDNALNGWTRKPIAFVGYGGVGGARAIQALRVTTSGLRMVPIGPEVNIAADTFMAALTQGKPLGGFDHLNAALGTLLNETVWWGNALKPARNAG